ARDGDRGDDADDRNDDQQLNQGEALLILQFRSPFTIREWLGGPMSKGGATPTSRQVYDLIDVTRTGDRPEADNSWRRPTIFVTPGREPRVFGRGSEEIAG